MSEKQFVVHAPVQCDGDIPTTSTFIVMAENKETAIQKAIAEIDDVDLYDEVDVNACEAYPLVSDEVVVLRWE